MFSTSGNVLPYTLLRCNGAHPKRQFAITESCSSLDFCVHEQTLGLQRVLHGHQVLQWQRSCDHTCGPVAMPINTAPCRPRLRSLLAPWLQRCCNQRLQYAAFLRPYMWAFCCAHQNCPCRPRMRSLSEPRLQTCCNHRLQYAAFVSLMRGALAADSVSPCFGVSGETPSISSSEMSGSIQMELVSYTSSTQQPRSH